MAISPCSHWTRPRGGSVLRRPSVDVGQRCRRLLLPLCALLCATLAPATTLVVNSSSDSTSSDAHRLTLREAIQSAPSGSTILFDPSLEGATIELRAELQVAGKQLTIDASGLPGGLTLSGERGDPDDERDNVRHFRLSGEVALTLRKLTLRDGFAVDGGAIHAGLDAKPFLLLEDCVIEDNRASYGGAILGFGTIIARDSLFRRNHAEEGGAILLDNISSSRQASLLRLERSRFEENTASFSGGALSGYFAEVVLLECNFAGNTADAANFERGRGGALALEDSSLEVIDSTFNSNLSGHEGGAISLFGGTGEIDDSRLEGNHLAATTSGAVGGAVSVEQANLLLRRSTLQENSAGEFGAGGALGARKSALTIEGSTFYLNSAREGGAIVSYALNQIASLSIVNSTLVRNLAEAGGAIFNLYGSLSLTHVTIAENIAIGHDAGMGGGGIFNESGLLILKNTLLARNEHKSYVMTAPGGLGATSFSPRGPDLWHRADVYVGAPELARVTLRGVNLLSDPAGSTLEPGPRLLVGEARLSALGEHGGPTQTMPPLRGSRAIDPPGGDTASTALRTDQRGLPRAIDGDDSGTAIADIGAVENLEGANLRAMDLAAYDLRDVSLTGARLQGADLSQNDLSSTTLDDAFYDAETQFPVGFAPGPARLSEHLAPTELSSRLVDERSAGRADVLESPHLYGLFDESSVQDLSLGRVLLARDPHSNHFNVRFQLQHSPDMGMHWNPLAQLLVDFDPSTNEIEANFPAPPGVFFFRFGRAP